MRKKRNSLWMRIISFTLVLTMVFTSLPAGCFSVSAEEAAGTEAEQADSSAAEPAGEEPYVIGEDVSRRGENEKHFLMSDGSSVAALYETDVHYRDETGAFQEIDNSFESAGDEYQTKDGKQKVKLAKKASAKKLVTIHTDDYKISWGFADAAKSRAEVQPMEENLADDPFAVKNLTGEMRYSDVFDGVDLRYLVTPEGVKEDIILKDRSARRSFTVYYDVGQLTARQKDSRTVELLAGDTVVYEIIAPVMTDANGSFCDALALTLTEQKNGKLTVVLTADSAWLDDSARYYPVTVDPMVMTKQDSATIKSKYITSANSNMNATGSLYVGNQPGGMGLVRTAVRYDNLPALSKGDMVCGAYMYLEQRTFSTYGDTTQQIHAHKIDAAWSGFNASSAGVLNNVPQSESAMSDYKIVTGSNTNTLVSWDITTAVKQWYNGGGNFGILLSMADSRKVLVQFASSFHTFAAHPILAVNYINNKGLEDYWSFTELSLGTSGTAYVNNYTGNLVVNLPICETASANLPASVSYYYNGYQAGRHYAPYCGGNTYDSSRSLCGAGWKTNLDETISYLSAGVGNNDQLHEQGYDYVYTDADGTVLYMKKKSTNVYEDELGKGLTLSLVNNQWILTDKQNNKKVFDSGGKLIEIYSNQSTDKIRLTYDSGGYLTKVTDGAGQEITFGRNSNHAVTSITSALGTTTFGFYGANLTSITYPDGEHTYISYYDDGRFRIIDNRDGSSVYYEYPTTGSDADQSRVIRVTERSDYPASGGRQDGNYLTFSYDSGNFTKVTDKQGRSVVYSFDNYGRTKSAVDETGAASAGYTSNSGTSGQNNKLTAVSSAAAPVNNLVTNHSFENGLTNWSVYNSDGATHASSDTSTAFIGGKSVKFTGTATNLNSTFYQVYTPTKTGKYTFSFYCKTAGMTGTGGMRAMIAVHYNDGTVRYFSGDYLLTSTGGEWERLSVTANVNDGVRVIHAIIAFQDASGTAWADCAQLEYSGAANDYNLVENSFFERDVQSWSHNGVSHGDGTWDGVMPISSTQFTSNQPAALTNAYRFKGAATVNKYVKQDIQINLPASQTALQFSGYACGNSVSKASGRYFSLDMCLHYSDGTNEYVVVDFNYSSTTWQFASQLVLPAKANQSKHVSSITVYFLYYQNLNWVAFSGMNVTLDKTGAVYSYDSKGNVVSAKDTAGREAVSTIDDANRLTGYKDEENVNYTYTYNTDNAILGTTKYQVKTAVHNGFAQRYEFSYDTHGNVTKTVKRHNTTGTDQVYPMQTDSTYSSSGDRLLSVTDSMRNTTTYGYNTANAKDQRVYSVTQNGTTVNYSYKSNTGLVSQVSANVTGIDGVQKTVSNSYAYTKDRLSSITHNGFTYNFAYDIFGNRTQTLVGTQPLMTDTYAAANGLLTRSTYGNGAYVENTYDRYDRVTARKYNGVQRFTYEYDANGRVSRHTDSVNNKTYTYTYDLLGRTQRVNGSDGSRIRYTYNNVNRTTGIGYTYGGVTKNFGYTYFAGGLYQTATYPNGATKTRQLNGQAQVRPTTLTTPTGQAWNTNCIYYTPPTTDGVQYTTNAVESLTYSNIGRTLSYRYDGAGNISRVVDSQNAAAEQTDYLYDGLNQLIRVNDSAAGKTTTYTYDAGGNILTKRRYSYTTGSLDGRGYVVVQYTYGNENWKDLLTAYNGNAITYDAIGNPLTYYNGTTFTWDAGRQLSTATKADGTELSFKYNDSGIRTSKTVDGTTTQYFLDGTSVIAEKTGNNILWFYYDGDGSREAVEYNGGVYYYLYNAQGDVLGLFDNNLNVVVNYTYDSWGNLLSVTGDMANTLGQANPFRYRGYYYDTETGLYYLNSRYYDPETGRFINADGYVSTGQGIFGNNMFTYCLNNPVNYEDPHGKMAGASGALAWSVAAGGANAWNPAGLIILGVAVVAAVAIWVIPWDSIGQSISNGWNQVKSSARSASISRSISKAVSKAKAKIRNEKRRYDYWIASYVDYGDGRGTYIPTTPLSYSRAISYVRAGGNVFADSRSNAYKLAKAAGGGIPARDPAHGGLGYWQHYHATRGGKRIGGHIFYVA